MFVVFFSFKGGVGRTTALMNTARCLAKKGKDVVVIDFDIEAPGIDIYEGTDLKIAEREYREMGYDDEKIGMLRGKNKNNIDQKGAVEYLLDAIEKVDKNGYVKSEPMKKYVYTFKRRRVNKKDKKVQFVPIPTEGKIYLLRAGLHEKEDYADNQRRLSSKIREMNKKIDVYTLMKKDMSDEVELLVRDIYATETHEERKKKLKDWEHQGKLYVDMLSAFKKEIRKLKPSYVLIDARPGLASVSIMAMQKLADVIVLCFNLTPWNFDSIREVYGRLTNEWKEVILNELLKIGLVISPIPRYAHQFEDFERQMTKIEDMEEAVNCGGTKELKPIVVPLNEQLALQDKLIVDDKQFEDDPTSLAYKKMANLLITLNPEDIENKIRRALDRRSINETKAEFKNLARKSTGRDKVQVLHSHGKYLLRMGEYKDAITILTEAVEESEKLEQKELEERIVYAGKMKLCYDLGMAYFNRCTEKKFEIEEKPRLLAKARENFHKSLAGGKTDRSCMMLGDAFFEEAMITREATERNKLREEARKWYKEAHTKNTDDAEYLFKLGKVNTKIATEQKRHDKIIEYRQEANKNFAEATKRREDYAEAYYYWGMNLYYLSRCYPEERDSHLKDANEKFDQAVKYKANYVDAFYLWGLSLTKIAGKNIAELEELIKMAEESGKTAESEYLKGCLRLAKSTELKPSERTKYLKEAGVHFGSAANYKIDFKEAYFFWGSQLFILQKLTEDKLKKNERLLDEITGKQKVETESKKLEKEINQLKNEVAYSFRDAFYRMEPAIALFFDYSEFYFDPNEIEEIKKDTHNFVYTLETMFNGNETYNRIKSMPNINLEEEYPFEPQFMNWLSKEELDHLGFSEYYEKLILKAVFKDFMTRKEKKQFNSREELGTKSIGYILNLINEIVSRDEIIDKDDKGNEITVSAWKNTKAGRK